LYRGIGSKRNLEVEPYIAYVYTGMILQRRSWWQNYSKQSFTFK